MTKRGPTSVAQNAIATCFHYSAEARESRKLILWPFSCVFEVFLLGLVTLIP